MSFTEAKPGAEIAVMGPTASVLPEPLFQRGVRIILPSRDRKREEKIRMVDMLVKLYALNWDSGFVPEQAERGIAIRKPIGPEKHVITDWVRENFSAGWASEADVAISRVPGACFIAVQSEQLIGFACYDATALGFFGPIGVLEAYRGKRTGNALLRACLLDMKLKGYGYAIIGQAGAVAFFEKGVGAVEIKDSTPGIYHALVRQKRVL